MRKIIPHSHDDHAGQIVKGKPTLLITIVHYNHHRQANKEHDIGHDNDHQCSGGNQTISLIKLSAFLGFHDLIHQNTQEDLIQNMLYH